MKLRSRALVAPLALTAALSAAHGQQTVVLKASTILDGKGHVLRDTSIVVEGEKIVAPRRPS